MKKFISGVLLLTITASTAAAYSRVMSDRARPRGREAGMMLDLQDFNLGNLNNVEDKKQYLSIVQLEKQRIEAFSLDMVYEDAYMFYRRGDYQRAHDLAESILSIDPTHAPARTLLDQSRMMGAFGALTEEEVIAAKMEEGKRLYNQGRLAEARRKFDEILVIQPHNAEAQSWLARVQKEIAGEYERRGDAALAKGDFNTALDNWYSALLARKHDTRLLNKIASAETRYKEQQIRSAMDEAMTLYNSGKLIGSYNAFQKVLTISPGERRATRYLIQLREEIANGYFASGQKAYDSRRYESAISNWQTAKKWGFSAARIDALIASARRAQGLRGGVAASGKESDVTSATGDTNVNRNVEVVTKIITHDAEDPSNILGVEEERRIITGSQTVTGSAQASGGSQSGGSVGGSASDYNENLPGGLTTRVSAEQRQQSQEAYSRGLAAYNNKDYETAKREFGRAVSLDPANVRAADGLTRIEELVAGK